MGSALRGDIFVFQKTVCGSFNDLAQPTHRLPGGAAKLPLVLLIKPGDMCNEPDEGLMGYRFPCQIGVMPKVS